jgi:hypothetical protein
VKERCKVVTKERGGKKWDPQGTCNDTNHMSIVPTEDENDTRMKEDKCGVKEYEL